MSGISKSPRTAASVVPADVTLVFDGGSLGNPGKGYGSFLLRGLVQTPSPVRLDFPGRTTSNEAEYLSLLHGLRTILRELERNLTESSATSLTVLSDSKLVVEQVNGRWKVRHEPLRPLHSEAVQLLAKFGTWDLRWQPRVESVRLLGH